jgi:hypothetical protein
MLSKPSQLTNEHIPISCRIFLLIAVESGLEVAEYPSERSVEYNLAPLYKPTAARIVKAIPQTTLIFVAICCPEEPIVFVPFLL